MLELLASGLRVQAIADRLCVSKRAVENCVTSMKCRFGADTTIEMMVVATRRGFLPGEECACA